MESRDVLGWITSGSSPRKPSKRHAKWRGSTRCYVGCSPEPSYSGNNGWVGKVFSFRDGHWKIIEVEKHQEGARTSPQAVTSWGDILTCFVPALIQRIKLLSVVILECNKMTILTIASPGRYPLFRGSAKKQNLKPGFWSSQFRWLFQHPYGCLGISVAVLVGVE